MADEPNGDKFEKLAASLRAEIQEERVRRTEKYADSTVWIDIWLRTKW